ncbi:MAG TPA: hypothetical protein DDW52_11870, partial [Planctomycetaceae bacterium]|nr:hypothetical protein [Planctomycetaceae bacterium]
DGSVSISGRVEHPSESGDGVRCSVVHRSGGNVRLIRSWTVAKGSAATLIEHIKLKEGDTVEFVTDCRTGPSHDSFKWQVTLTQYPKRQKHSSERSFSGPQPQSLGPTAILCQALLACNELAFVD